MSNHAKDLVTSTRKTKTGRVISVLDYSLRYQKAVIAELESLLERARVGEFIGMTYAVTRASDRTIQAGASGILAKDRLKTAGLLFGVAMRVAEDLEE